MRLIKEAFDQEYEESKKANEEEFGKVSGKYCDRSTKSPYPPNCPIMGRTRKSCGKTAWS